MNEIIQGLEANATNGKENFCYISENKLLAMKELSKRDYEEYKKVKQALNEIKEYIKSESPDAGVSGKRILEIIEKVSEEE